MLRFLFRRLLLIAFTLLVVSIAIFAVTEILPGDVAKVILGQNATPEGLDALRRELGLYRPAPERYLDWILSALQGDLGTSYVQKTPITTIIDERIWNSLVLAGVTLLIAVPLAVLAGIWTGIRPDGASDRALSLVGLVGMSLPEFVTGVLLIVLFSTLLGWLPSSSMLLPGTTPLSRPEVLVMPGLTLTAVVFAHIMRMTRASVIEVMQTNYVRTARLKGLAPRKLYLRHVVPNAMLPTVTIIAINVGFMLGGLIIVENVFAYPGLGQLLMISITTRDVPLLQALSLIIAGACALSNLVADVSYALLNPRIRLA